MIVNHALIAANVLLFIYTAARSARTGGEDGLIAQSLVDRWGLVYNPVELWRFVTYSFLHAGWLHLIGNMLTLWVFGPNVEDRLGRIGYLSLYIAGAIGAGLSHVWLSSSPVIGASGAVAAVTGAYLVLFPRTTIRTFLLIGLIGVFHILAVWYIGIAIGRDFLMHGFAKNDGIARAAHLGGYAVGITVSFLLLATRILDREMYDMFTLFDRARRKREIRSAADYAASNDRIRKASNTKRTKSQRSEADTESEQDADAIVTMRADVASRIARGDLKGAADSYAAMLARYSCGGADRRLVTLGKHNQLTVANHYFQTAAHRDAAAAYLLFIEAYPNDPQKSHVQLMRGLLLARYLGDSAGAKREITDAMSGLSEPEDIELAKMLLSELGCTEKTTP